MEIYFIYSFFSNTKSNLKHFIRNKNSKYIYNKIERKFLGQTAGLGRKYFIFIFFVDQKKTKFSVAKI